MSRSVRTLEIPFPLSVNQAYRSVRGTVLKSKAARIYQASVAEIGHAACSGAELMAGRLAIEMRVWCPDRRRRDLDNLWKLPLDALSGIVWVDDSQFDDKRIIRAGISRDAARAVLSIWTLADADM